MTLAGNFKRLFLWITLVGAMIFCLQIVLVLFWGGINLQFGNFQLRSTTIESPTIAFLVALLLWFVTRGKGKEAVLFCFSLFFAGLLGEGVLRGLDPPLAKPYLKTWYKPSDLLGWQLVPDFEAYGPLDVLIKTNSHGQRDVEHPWEKKAKTIRILGLGDSFAFGWGVPLQATFLKKMEVSLHEKTGEKVEVINAGVPGWGLNQFYVYLKNFGIKYSPDVVLLAYFIDDLQVDLLEVIPANQNYQNDLRFEGGILHYSKLYNFLKSFADQIRYKNRHRRVEHFFNLDARRQEWAKRNLLLTSGSQLSQQGYIDLLQQHLGRIKLLSEENEAVLIVVLIPDVSQLHHPKFQHINTILENLTKEAKIPFFDLTKILESSPDLTTYYLLPKDHHTNAAGHSKMAEALSPLVCGVLSRKGVSCGAKKGVSQKSSSKEGLGNDG